MGNNQSRGESPQSPSPAPAPLHARSSTTSPSAASAGSREPNNTNAGRNPKRRQSIHALQGGKGEPVAPTATSATAEYKSSHSSSATSARVPASQASTRPTTASSSRSQHWLSNASPKPADGSPRDRVGAELGRHALPPSPLRADDVGPAPEPEPGPAPQPELEPEPEPEPEPESVGPMDVPAGPIAEGVDEAPILPDQSYSFPPPSGFSRPPRLPLPIEEEDHTPGSPIISPADLKDDVDSVSGDADGIKRTRSMLSGTTVDEEEVDDDAQGSGGIVGEAIGPAVPTVIEWRGGGDKVYVTGTFAGWDRKYRLHKDGPSKHKDALSAVINLHPGTHHLNFIVDGEMRLSHELPTAVDFTNFLVNYVEVLPHEQQHPPAGTLAPTAAGAPAAAPSPADPIDIKPPPGAAPGTALPAGPPKKPQYRAPAGVRPPQVLPPTPELVAVPASDSRSAPPQTQETQHPQEPTTAQKDHQAPPKPQTPPQPKGTRIPTKYYHNTVPNFLVDLDAQEGSTTQRNAIAAAESLPAPPTLPLFLSKSVLNGAMPMKDDASVLVMPNHTVLNHLATSSIRQGVLATSATTRYRQKFLTTIIYKPTSEGND